MINTHQFMSIAIIMGFLVGVFSSGAIDDVEEVMDIFAKQNNYYAQSVDDIEQAMNDTGADIGEKQFDSSIGNMYSITKMFFNVIWGGLIYGILPFGTMASIFGAESSFELILKIIILMCQLLMITYFGILIMDKWWAKKSD